MKFSEIDKKTLEAKVANPSLLETKNAARRLLVTWEAALYFEIDTSPSMRQHHIIRQGAHALKARHLTTAIERRAV